MTSVIVQPVEKNAAIEEHTQELLQLEALLLARAYAYELLSKLLGGTPDEDILRAVTEKTTQDVFEEYADASEELGVFAELLCSLRAADSDAVLDGMRGEYTRIFIGPAALPASPYESPYISSHDTALFQENTIATRRCYAHAGLAPKRVQAIPDDHIAMMLSFMAVMSARTLEDYLSGNLESLREALREQRMFAKEHMGSWLDVFATSVRNSEVGEKATLYPQLLEALSAFVKIDRSFLVESLYWASTQGQIDAREPAEELTEARTALHELKALLPLGASDFEMIPIKS